MKKILIATTNQRKFNIDAYLLKKAGLRDEYAFYSLADIDYNGEEIKEQGSNVDRAREKALNVKEHIKKNAFDFIIGIDDGMILKGEKIENIKDYLTRILYEDYLKDGESISFSRAYFMIDSNGQTSSSEAIVPFTFKQVPNASLEGHPYPLEQVVVPLGKDKTLSELTDSEYYEYYWKHSRTHIQKLLTPFHIDMDYDVDR